MNVRWRETHFKFLHQAIYGFHIPPHPNCPDMLTACPKCNTPKTNLIHGAWRCSAVSQFWTRLLDFVNSKMNLRIASTPQIALFHIFPPESRFPRVLHIILLAAFRSLLAKWLEPSVPSVTEVLIQIKHYLHMDKLETLRSKTTSSKSFFKKWKSFIVSFLNEEEIRQLMLPFRNTTWYLSFELSGTLGGLRITE